MSKTVVLLILDGWGVGERSTINPIYATHPEIIEHIKSNYPACILAASGPAIGLPWNEPGNSEIGHFILGTGRVAPHTKPALNTLGDVLAAHRIAQIYIAETSRYKHLTHFFNGLRDEPRSNEFRILVPETPTAHQDTHPEMMTQEITNRVIQAIEESIGFVAANIAAPDVIAHTGNWNAAIKTIRAVDEAIGKIITSTLAKNATLIITADHGNIEQMRNLKTGSPETAHNLNPVPLYLIANQFKKEKTSREIAITEEKATGTLADVAPTILELMKIPQPKEMTGMSLLKTLWNL